MVRTQISLTEEQHRFLKEMSHETGESLSSLIRRAVENLRDEHLARARRALELLGAFKADKKDVSVRHDHYLVSKAKP